MRNAYLFSAASLLILTSSLAMPRRQDEPMAENVFKNIKSLRGKKASDVIPSMQFMSAALKVDCDYCHTKDRASDEKGEKNTAREMIAMQNDINEKNFGGRTQVTCATCHAGHTHPVNLSPAMGIEARARRSRDVTADQVVAAYTKAVGDAKPIGDIAMEGTTIEGKAKIKVDEFHSGDKFFLDVHREKEEQKIGFNGVQPWMLREGGIFNIPRQFADEMINSQTLLVGPASLPKLSNPSAGTAKIDDRDMLVLMGGIEGSKNRASIFFDKATGLPARLIYTYPTILGSIAQVNDYSDYKRIGGVPIPTTIAHHSAEQDLVVHFSSIRPNAKLDSKIFDSKQ